jgi:hypothetical protein
VKIREYNDFFGLNKQMLKHISSTISSTEMVSHCCKGEMSLVCRCIEQQDAQANSQLLRDKFLLQLFGVGLLLSAVVQQPTETHMPS